MNKTFILLVVFGILLAIVGSFFLLTGRDSGVVSQLQDSEEKIARIGILVRGKSYVPGVEGFLAKMKQLGYVEGENVEYFTKFIDDKKDLPGAVRELLLKNVDVFHTYSTPATVEVYNQTKQIPIVFGSMGDPLASKTVKALDRSETNVTGVSSLSAPLVVKRLEFLLAASPGIKRVAFALTPDDIPGKSSYNFILEAAEKLGVEVVPYWIDAERDVTETARAIKATDVDGIVLSSDSLTWAHLSDYVDQSVQEGLPFAVFHKDMVLAGGLVGYGPDYFGSGEQSAVLVDKILRGQKPTDLPIESPGKLILAVNLKTALAIGITLPSALLQRADIVINE